MGVEQVWQNFKYRLDTLTAPADSYGVADTFEYLDPEQHDPTNPERSRLFVLDWVEAGPENQVGGDTIVCDQSLRITDHRFRLRVIYNRKLRHEALQRLMLKDRKTVIKELRDPAKYDGVSASSPSTDTGLEHRWKEQDSVSELGDSTVVWESIWVCTIQETD